MDPDQNESANTVTLSNNSKRARDDSDHPNAVSPESKMPRVDSVNSGINSSDLVQNGENGEGSAADGDRVDSDDSGVNSPEAKLSQQDLLSILDESDEPVMQGLDTVIKSFEEEIQVPDHVPEVIEVVSQPELGYLLEASDDELGLPPTSSGGEEGKTSPFDLSPTGESGGAVDFGSMMGLVDEMPGYDSFPEFGFSGENNGVSNAVGGYNDTGDFVALGGLFDFSDQNGGPADIPGLQPRHESLPAL